MKKQTIKPIEPEATRNSVGFSRIEVNWDTARKLSRMKYSQIRKIVTEGLDELKIGYSEYNTHKNYLRFPKTYLHNDSEGVAKYNAVIRFMRQGLGLDENTHLFTKSGGVSVGRCGYAIKRRKTGYEIVFCLMNTCARVILDAFSKAREDGDQVGGYNSSIWLKNELAKDNVRLEDYAVSNGEEIKRTIPAPVIDMTLMCKKDKTYEHAHHLDLNSAYASGIIAAHPEMGPTYRRLYARRAENAHMKARIKSLFTNSTGFFQSEYCSFGGHKYALAGLAKDAMRWTRNTIFQYASKLMKAGYTPLLYNTDGIWYAKLHDGESVKSEPYEDEGLGNELGTYKTDHADCTLRVRSKGAYEYIEDGAYTPVVRGIPKSASATWTWGGIYRKEATHVTLLPEMTDNTLKETVYEID